MLACTMYKVTVQWIYMHKFVSNDNYKILIEKKQIRYKFLYIKISI